MNADTPHRPYSPLTSASHNLRLKLLMALLLLASTILGIGCGAPWIHLRSDRDMILVVEDPRVTTVEKDLVLHQNSKSTRYQDAEALDLANTPLGAHLGLSREELESTLIPFGITQDIRDFAERNTRYASSRFQQVDALLQAIYVTHQLSTFYDSEQTLTADNTLRHKRGNCFAFTNLFVASARAIGIPAYYMNATRGNGHLRTEDGKLLHEGHIVARAITNIGTITVDFFQAREEEINFWYQPLTDRDAIAMFINNLGYRAMARGEDAEPYFRTAIHLAPKLAPPWNNLAVVLKSRGDRVQARHALEEAAAQRVSSFAPYYNLGLMFIEERAFHKAEKSFKRAILRYFDNPYAFYELGVAYANQGKFKRARLALRMALRIDRGLDPARSKLDRLNARR